ncbi:cation:proton antiporter [Marinobacter sp. AN1]|uniref:cation:proton antiporter n=1 Tax=Marinobacter sp. AN1 TaxID=2886046 RepID=UPI0022307186|nr:cation:proton antiporter [Marinobacter sp. AN1]UZD67109.1 cation:proton antiporter [Marinobacter sp. AN1]
MELALDPAQYGMVLVILGGLLSISILADVIAARTAVPRISLLVLVGVVVAAIQQWGLGEPAGPLTTLAEPLIQLALVMVAFLLGGEFTWDRLRTLGPVVGIFSLTVVLASGTAVGLGLWLLGFPVILAVALAAISVATDPAAVSETIHELRAGNTRAGRLLLSTVAVDDGWGIIVFGLAMAFLGWHASGDGLHAMLEALWELGGAVALGVIVGIPAAWLTGRLEAGEPTLVEALALILLLAGGAALLNVSELLAAMIAGAIVANLAYHHTRSFNEIDYLKWPFLVFFFVLAGASLDLNMLGGALGVTGAYIVLRLLGRYLGGLVGARAVAGRLGALPCGIGMALTPQAGVAMGMALLAGERFPEFSATLMAVVVGSTVFFEAIGPWLVRRTLRNNPLTDNNKE